MPSAFYNSELYILMILYSTIQICKVKITTYLITCFSRPFADTLAHFIFGLSQRSTLGNFSFGTLSKVHTWKLSYLGLRKKLRLGNFSHGT